MPRVTGNMTTVAQTAIRTIPQIHVISLSIILPLGTMRNMDATLAVAVIVPSVLFVFPQPGSGSG